MRAIASIRSPVMAISPWLAAAPVPSKIVPPRIEKVHSRIAYETDRNCSRRAAVPWTSSSPVSETTTPYSSRAACIETR